MKKINIIYWIITVLFAAFMFVTAIPDIMNSKEAADFVTKMGYPPYFVPYIGVAKALGCIAIVIPGFPRLKEWAYAGLVYDLISAMYSFMALGYPFTDWIFMLLPLAFAALSYIYYHKRLKAMSIARQPVA